MNTDDIPTPDGARIHMSIAGSASGTPVVLVHGFGGSNRDWEQVIPLLDAAGLRTIAVDLRGHGSSTAGRRGYSHDALIDDLAVVVAQLNTPPILVGHSMGSAVVLGLLTRKPDVAAAVLTAAVAAAPITAAQRAASSFLVSPIGSLVLAMPHLGRAVLGGMLHKPSPPGLAELLRRGFLAVNDRKAIDAGMRHVDHRPRLGAIAVPVVVLAGAADRATPSTSQAAIATSIPNARFEVLDRAGHFTPLESPAEIAGVIVELASTAARRLTVEGG